MSFVTAAPEMLATAAQNVANIGTSLSAAKRDGSGVHDLGAGGRSRRGIAGYRKAVQ